MSIVPFGDRVIVKVQETMKKSPGGIIIPEQARVKTHMGTVTAIGDDLEIIKVAIGDDVMFDAHAGTAIKINDEEHLIFKMCDLLGRVL